MGSQCLSQCDKNYPVINELFYTEEALDSGTVVHRVVYDVGSGEGGVVYSISCLYHLTHGTVTVCTAAAVVVDRRTASGIQTAEQALTQQCVTDVV